MRGTMNHAFDFNPYEYTLDGTPMAMDLRHIQLLYRVIVASGVQTAVEIGAYRGASTSAFIEALNRGLLERLTIFEVAPTASLKRVIESCVYPEKIDLRAHAAWDQPILDADLIFIDGDHQWQSLADLAWALTRNPDVICMHDSRDISKDCTCWGSEMASGILRSRVGFIAYEDFAVREGELTHRGFMVSARKGIDMNQAFSET